MSQFKCVGKQAHITMTQPMERDRQAIYTVHHIVNCESQCGEF